MFKKITTKLLLLITLIFLLDLAVGSVLRSAYFKQTSGLQYRTTYSVEQTTADILFFGSSRCNHHYDPRIFENRLKLTAYNVGRDGNGLPYHFGVLKGILSRYTPKVVVLDLLKGDLDQGDGPFVRLSSLLPYYKSHPEIRDVIDERSEFEQLKLISSIYPFNSSLLTIAIGNMGFNRERNKEIKGFLPLKKKWNKALRNGEKHNASPFDDRKVLIYEKFLTECRKRNIKVYVLVSPYYEYPSYDKGLVTARQLAIKHNAIFWDFSENENYLNAPYYFADPAHLNTKGAERYSSMIAQRMRESNHSAQL